MTFLLCDPSLTSRINGITAHTHTHTHTHTRTVCTKHLIDTGFGFEFMRFIIYLGTKKKKEKKERKSSLYLYGHTYSMSRDQPGKVADPSRGQLNREK